MKLSPRLALLLTMPPLLWAGNAVVGRHMASQIPPLLLNGLRWALAGLLLLLIAPSARALLRSPAPLWQRWGYLAVVGFLGMGCYNALQYQALRSSTALNVTLIAASMPLGMMMVGALVYGERPTRRQLAGALLSLVGVALVLARGSWAALLQVHFVAGDLLMLLAVLSWSIYSWLLARPPASLRAEQAPGWDWAAMLMAQIAFGAPIALAMAGIEQGYTEQAVHWGPGLAWVLAYVAIGPSLIAYRCWGLGVAQAGPALAAFFVNLTPLFAALMSAALLGEWPAWYHGAAFALIAGGIVVSAGRR
ncbi:DMT family transporter [Pelomonas sp. V22]|uniref:DMT family transporter n=1 Tax=Pelomonas sp. V22 TaxID=2822139 RepID=UPI0024A99FDC|nr:DMT family transporter [Pelomonas sp. V22]MDI4631938.1 DMT family transporter [Pelomonas sp. V22]